MKKCPRCHHELAAITAFREFTTRDRIYQIICTKCDLRHEIRYTLDEMVESGLPEMTWQELEKRLIRSL